MNLRNTTQAMFVVHEHGVILVDVPPPLAAFAAGEFIAHQKTKPVIVAHEATQRILARAKDQCLTMEQSLRLD